jgi:hypothetical protein
MMKTKKPVAGAAGLYFMHGMLRFPHDFFRKVLCHHQLLFVLFMLQKYMFFLSLTQLNENYS